MSQNVEHQARFCLNSSPKLMKWASVQMKTFAGVRGADRSLFACPQRRFNQCRPVCIYAFIRRRCGPLRHTPSILTVAVGEGQRRPLCTHEALQRPRKGALPSARLFHHCAVSPHSPTDGSVHCAPRGQREPRWDRSQWVTAHSQPPAFG